MKNFFRIFSVLAIVSATSAISKKFIQTNNILSIKLYQELVKTEQGSFVFGILPLDAIIALTYYGARGDTALQIKSVFGWNTSDDQIIKNFESTMKALESINQFKIHLVNKVYVPQRFVINPEFNENAPYFNASIVMVDTNSSEKNQTNDKIENRVDENFVTPQAQLVFVNNVYIQGEWLYGFQKNLTGKMDFHISNNETIKSDMMRATGHFMVSRNPSLKISMIKLPFKNEKVYMIIVISDNIDDVDSIATNANQLWNDRNFTRQSITLYLPKFKVASEINMIPTLKKMGVNNLFSSADLSGITKQANSVSIITQKINIDVDERGTNVSPISEHHEQEKQHTPKEQGTVFKVDHPFVFGILHHEDLSLIFGRINKC